MRHKTAIINNFTAHNKLKFFNNSKLFGKCNKTFSKGDGGVGTFDVGGGLPSFLVQIFQSFGCTPK